MLKQFPICKQVLYHRKTFPYKNTTLMPYVSLTKLRETREFHDLLTKPQKSYLRLSDVMQGFLSLIYVFGLNKNNVQEYFLGLT